MPAVGLYVSWSWRPAMARQDCWASWGWVCHLWASGHVWADDRAETSSSWGVYNCDGEWKLWNTQPLVATATSCKSLKRCLNVSCAVGHEWARNLLDGILNLKISAEENHEKRHGNTYIYIYIIVVVIVVFIVCRVFIVCVVQSKLIRIAERHLAKVAHGSVSH
jgi:hypothetical protein